MSDADLLDRSDERDTALKLRHAAYREGYVHGAQDQWAAGYVSAIADVKRLQHEHVEAVRLGVRRLAPGGEAWLASVERHNGTEYGGAGKPRVPVDPRDIEQARREAKGRAE